MKRLELMLAGVARDATFAADVARQFADVVDVDVEQLDLLKLRGLRHLPEVLWVHLGAVNNSVFAHMPGVKALAALQAQETKLSLIYVSGSAPPETRLPLAREVFSAFPNPERVEVDFEGDPDLVAALEKYLTIEKAAEQKKVKLPDADLRVEGGNLSAKLIASLYNVSLRTLCSWMGKKIQTVSKTPDSDALQDTLKPYATVARMRFAFDEDADRLFRVWLKTDHPLLDNKSPLHWIELGKVIDVADFVLGALSGQAT